MKGTVGFYFKGSLDRTDSMFGFECVDSIVDGFCQAHTW